jgi:hypothetical protein
MWWTSARFRRSFLAAAVVAGFGAAPPAAAQPPRGWQVDVAGYLWMAGIGGEVGIGDRTAEVSVGFGDLLEKLGGAFMGVVEARGGPVILRLDGMYVAVGDDRAFVIGRRELELSVDVDQVVLQPTAGFTVVSGRHLALDLLVGARYVSFETTLGAATGEGREAERTRKVDWWDATGGARARFSTGRWRLALSGDAGTGGSDVAWQALATAAYDFSECCALAAGYRYLALDYDERLLLLDLHIHGPAIAFVFRL